MSEALEAIFHVNTLTSTLRLATPIALAAMAGTLSERVGVINLALEAKLLAGAFAGAYASYVTGSAWLGVGAAVLAGVLIGALLGLFTLRWRANHVVAGIGLNILALGLTTWLLQVIWGSRGTSPVVPDLPGWSIPGLQAVPLLGPLLSGHSPLVYVMLLAGPLLWVWLFKTPGGLRARMIGEHPEAADTVGIPVRRTQFLLLLAAGALAALGGSAAVFGALVVVQPEHVRGPRLHGAGRQRVRPLEPAGQHAGRAALRLHRRSADAGADAAQPAANGAGADAAVFAHHPGGSRRVPQGPAARRARDATTSRGARVTE